MKCQSSPLSLLSVVSNCAKEHGDQDCFIDDRTLFVEVIHRGTLPGSVESICCASGVLQVRGHML
jgi:hypothetical protein